MAREPKRPVDRTTTTWGQRMRETIRAAHPGWVRREDVVLSAMDLVPPGRAFRFAEKQAEWVADDRGYNHPKRELSDQAVAAGARQVCQRALWSAIKGGIVERRYDDDGVQWLRWIGYKPRPPSEEMKRRGSLRRPRTSEEAHRAWQSINREAHRRAVRESLSDPETRAKMRESHIRVAMTMTDEERQAKRERTRREWEDPDIRARRIAGLRRVAAEQTFEERSARIKQAYKEMTPEQREERRRRISEGVHRARARRNAGQAVSEPQPDASTEH